LKSVWYAIGKFKEKEEQIQPTKKDEVYSMKKMKWKKGTNNKLGSVCLVRRIRKPQWSHELNWTRW